MILARSPYYKDVPWLRPSDNAKADSFTLELFVWVGDVASVPTQPQYSKTIYNVESSSDTLKVGIANLISDFIPTQTTTSTTTEILNGNNTVWVKSQVEYDFEGDITTELIETDFSTNGYGYGYDGENYQPTKTLLSDSQEVDAYQNGYLQVPFLRSQVDTNKLEVLSMPSETTIFFESVLPTDESTEIVSILNVNCKDILDGDTYLEISYGALNETLCVFIRNEYKKQPYDVTFLNRYGHTQTMTFFKERVDNMSVKGESYQNRFEQPLNGSHQFTDFNINGQDTFTLESGYVTELQNNLVTEMLLSEAVWIGENPINVETKSVQYKTLSNDKLVNYKVRFKNSYTKINTI